MSFTDLWTNVLSTWDDHAALDLHERFSADVLDPAIASRPWWWFRARIYDLAGTDGTRINLLLRREVLKEEL